MGWNLDRWIQSPASSLLLKGLIGASLTLYIHLYLRKRALKSKIKAEIMQSIESLNETQTRSSEAPSLSKLNFSEQEILMREQLSRNYSFLGQEVHSLLFHLNIDQSSLYFENGGI